MSFGSSPFGSAPFGSEDGAGLIIHSATGISTAASTAAGVTAAYNGTVSVATGSSAGSSLASAAGSDRAAHDHWADVVFLARCDRTLGAFEGKVRDEAGHAVITGVNSHILTDNSPIGSGRLVVSSGVEGGSVYVDGLSSNFNGFSLADSWTVEFRAIGTTGGCFLAVQSNDAATPLNIRATYVSTGVYRLVVQPHGSPNTYITTDTFSDSVWVSFCIESNGSSLLASANGSACTFGTPSTSLAVSSASANALTIGALDKNKTTTLTSIDELRVSKLARYGASPPVSPWPFYSPIDASTVVGASVATSSVSGAGDFLTGGLTGSQGTSKGVATCFSIFSRRVISSAGNSSGAASVIGCPSLTLSSNGSSSAWASVTGAGKSIHPAVGAAPGSSEVLAEGIDWRIASSVGAAIAMAFAGGEGAGIAAAYSVVVGHSAVSGAGAAVAKATGACEGRSICCGRAPLSYSARVFSRTKNDRSYVTSKQEVIYVRR